MLLFQLVQKWETMSAEQRCQWGIRLPLIHKYTSFSRRGLQCSLLCVYSGDVGYGHAQGQPFTLTYSHISVKLQLLLITHWETLGEQSHSFACPQNLKGHNYREPLNATLLIFQKLEQNDK